MLKPALAQSHLPETKQCLECNETLSGRSDKKFCDDHCRTSFNNRSRSVDTNFIRNTDNRLRRNRRILRHFLEAGVSKVRREQLAELGYLFPYHTTRRLTGGEEYLYVYEYGILELPEHEFLIVKNME
ncbi:MAG: hypothetical protein IT233_11305 [Bacteroidia bacterium]|nr:hypothetical protein [Bacteroidia bacterium]